VRSGLGKGFFDLIGEQLEDSTTEVSIDAIIPHPGQPRRHFAEESLQELATSIKEKGLLQPLLVRPLSEDKYEIIAGERRWRACQLANIQTVLVIVKSVGDQELLELALIENIQREDISPLECAVTYKKLIDNFGLTQEQIARKVGKSRSVVANTLRLLNLAIPIQEALQSKKITEGHARTIVGLKDPITQEKLYRKIKENNWTVREAEKEVQNFSSISLKEASNVSVAHSIQDNLGNHLKAKALILHEKSNNGKIIIEFRSREHLSQILKKIGL